MNATRLAPLLLSTVLLTAGLAQQALVVHLRDPSGNPVAGARGDLLCAPAHWLTALGGLPAAHHPAVGATSAVAATSDASGVLRFPGAEPRAGSGMVATGTGLGALIERLRPGIAQRITMRPMAEVGTSTGTEEFTLWARARLPDDDVVQLPPLVGTTVRLPEGDYEVWARNADGWIWQRLHLRSGGGELLEFVGAAQRVRGRASAWIRPAGWPEVPLVAPGGETVLLGTAMAAPLTAGVPNEGLVVTARTLPLPPTVEAVTWPPVAGDAPVAIGLADPTNAVTTAELFSLRAMENGSWRVSGAARLDATRHFHLPRPTSGDTWLLLVAPGHAPLAMPWSPTAPPMVLAPARGAPLLVRARTDGGDPVVDLVVDYVPDGAAAATVRAHTDARGHADLGLVSAPGRVALGDPRFANQEVALDAVPGDGLVITVAPGEAIAGRIVFPDGAAARGAMATLRDLSGRLRPAARAVAVAGDGAFAFTGLPAEREFVLFATTTRGGRTWSGRLGTVRSGRTGVELVVRDEDPQLQRDEKR